MNEQAIAAVEELVAPVVTVSQIKSAGNTLTIGGVTLKRPSGGQTIASPLVVYDNITDDQVNEFWTWLAANETVQAAQLTFNKVVAAELMKWGAKRDGVEVDDNDEDETAK